MEELVDSDSEKPLTRSEASLLLRNMNKLETAFMTSLWCDILQTFNNVSNKLLTIKINLSSVVGLYNTLIEYIKTLRTMFNIYEKLAQDKFEENVPQFERKNRKRKKQIDETNELNSLAVLPIESSITCKLDFNEIIKTFAEKQARRKNI